MVPLSSILLCALSVVALAIDISGFETSMGLGGSPSSITRAEKEILRLKCRTALVLASDFSRTSSLIS